MKKLTLTAAVAFCAAILSAAPVPVLEYKLDTPDLAKLVNTGSMKDVSLLKAYNKDKFGEAEGRKGGKMLAFNNLLEKQPTNKVAGLQIPCKKDAIDFTKPFTLMAFVKLNEGFKNNGPQYNILGTSTGSYGPGWRLYYSWHSFRFTCGDGKKPAKGTVCSMSVDYRKNKINAGNWNHLAVVFDGTETALYFNGKQVAKAKIAMFNNPRGPLNIGCYNNGYAYGMAGCISDVKLFNSALSDAEVAAEAAK